MTSAKLFILGEERELLWINTNYYRSSRIDGSPTSDVEGGFISLSFVSQENDDVFWHNMTKTVEKETDRMEKGEVHFYNKGDKDIPIRKFKFSDAYLIEYSEVFNTDETESMHIVLTISPAIQDYGAELVKHWHVSWISPSEPSYYQQKEEVIDNTGGIINMYWTYGDTKLSDKSRFYVDMNLVVKTKNYNEGESIIVNIKCEGGHPITDRLNELRLTGMVGKDGIVIFEKVLKDYTLNLLGEDN
ncbi:hypothetical protein OIU80_06785 [Flavobacterium sp. LS1R47]|uniref:Uncharacterized protein n=1 Tax=Flavobacterium frigoritolerans TaxID=2987686 RepID=A0A9X2YZV2_9FLAO|nr:type VI secretion system tube protein TssD [Flavobacterium frigoritolerans]MCV9931984.1 hypothetical protein [Flavobacterium frigoritolerans]